MLRGFISRELLMSAGGAATGLFLVNKLPDYLANMAPSLTQGWGRIATQAALGIAGAYLLKRFNASTALGFGAGALASAGLSAWTMMQGNNMLPAGGHAASNDGSDALESTGVSGFIDSDGNSLAGYLADDGVVYDGMGLALGQVVYG